MGKSKDLFKEFVKIEKEYDLFNLKVAGVYLWERIRTQVYFKLHGKIFEVEEPQRRRSKLRLAISLITEMRKNPFFTRQKDVIFVGHTRRILQEDGKWLDMYSDYVIDELDLSTVLVEPVNMSEHNKPAKTKHLKYLDFIDGVGLIKRLLRINRLTLTTDEEIYLKYLSMIFLQRIGHHVDILGISRSVLTRRKQNMPMIDKLLNRIKPKVVVVIVSYGNEDIIEACKDKSIPVIELQHGVVSRYHPGYSFQGNRKLTFPDYFLTWGDYWKNSVEYPIPEENVISVGFPHSEISTFEVQDKTQSVLFLSQPRLGVQFANFALEFSKIHNQEVVFKLHPKEYKDWEIRYPMLIDSGVTVIADEFSLYTLFTMCQSQVGVFSTTIYEGLDFGLKTFLVDFAGVEYFDKLIRERVVYKVKSPEELNRMIEKFTPTKFENDYFFKRNSVKNITEFIEKIAAEESK